MANKLDVHLPTKLIAFFVIGLGICLISSVKASAISSTFPNSENNPNNVNMKATVSVAGDLGNGVATGLQAPMSDFKIFIPANYAASTVQVVLEGICQNNSNEDVGTTNVAASAYQTQANTREPGARVGVGICSGASMIVNIPRASFNDAQKDLYGDQYRTALVRVARINSGTSIACDLKNASCIGTTVGEKSFRVTVPSMARVTFSDISLPGSNSSSSYNDWYPGGSAFAIQNATNSGPNVESSYKFTFIPDCNYRGQTIFMKWSDADYNSNVEGTNIAWSLREAGGPEIANRSGAGMGGNNEYKFQGVSLEPGKRYIWEWTGVDRTNGVQLWMPFSERSTQECPVNPDFTLTALCDRVRGFITDPNYPAEQFRYTLRLQSGQWNSGMQQTGPNRGYSVDFPGNQFFGASNTNRTFMMDIYRSDGTFVKTVSKVTGADNPPCSPETPNFELARDCRVGPVRNVLRIENLANPPGSGHENNNVAVRVRVYPNQQGSGIVIDRNGNVQGETSTFAAKGSFDVAWPSGYGTNISWRVDVRAFAYGRGSSNDTTNSRLIAGFVVNPCPSWTLQPTSTVDSPFVEIGTSTTFKHYVTNNDPYNAGGKWAYVGNCILYNYNPNNINGGAGGARNCLDSFNANIGPGGPQLMRSGVLGPDGDAPLGQTYCQAYRVSPAAEEPGGLASGGANEAISEACTVVVGGKTKLGVTGDKAEIEPSESTAFNAAFNTDRFGAGGGWTGYDVNCAYTMTYQYKTSDPLVNMGGGNCSVRVSGINPNQIGVSYPFTATDSDIGKRICISVTATVSNPNFFVNPGPASTQTGQACTRVITRPYVKVYSGDVISGTRYATSGICVNKDASVEGWNINNTAFTGAGANLAVFAQNRIYGFASGQGLPVADNSAYAPANLSFGNASVASIGSDYTNGGLFGGNYNGGNCIPNFYGELNELPVVETWPAHGINQSTTYSNQNFQSGAVTLPGDAAPVGTVTNSAKVRLFADGNVFINGDIAADSSTVTSPEQIPTFTLVTRGDIYISKDVGRLYGTYIAQPRADGTGGNIYTCASAPNIAYKIDSDGYTNCQKQLVVTGAFVANKVNLLRTKGSLMKDGGGGIGGSGYQNAAEIFRYNPLMWLRQAASEETQGNWDYDTITTLPPVL